MQAGLFTMFGTLVGSGAFQSFESAVAFLVGYTAAEYDVLICAEMNLQTPHAIAATSFPHRRSWSSGRRRCATTW